MKVKGKINNVSFNMKGEAILSLEVHEKNTLLREYDTLKDIEILDIEIKKHRKKRSLNANAYLWVLVNEIGNALNMSKEEVYLIMLKRYGQCKLVSVLSEIDVAGYLKYYEAAGTTVLNGKEFTHYKVFKGSSEYDTDEMSVLLNGVVDEAQDLGIATLEDLEIERMAKAWKGCQEI